MKIRSIFVLVLIGILTACSAPTTGTPFPVESPPPSDLITCEAPGGETIPMPTTYLYFEHNSTAGDTGIHGMFDSPSFAELCVYDPSGKQILAIKPQNQLAALTMAGIFFESREPEHADVSVEDHLRNFPEGQYAIRGVNFEGIGYHGAATLTHDIPKPPKMIFPLEMADEANIESQSIVPVDVVVSWEPVTETIFDKPANIRAYEVIVRSMLPNDPHGFSHDNLDIHLPASATSLSIPNEFWKLNTPYEFEVLAIEESGNQTLTSGFFTTTDEQIYTVNLTAADFVPAIDNPYYPLIPGSKWVYEATLEDGTVERNEVEVLQETRVVNGVAATVIHDTVWVEGQLVEETYDWYAQDKDGNVWYLGEEVDNYENGQLKDHAGSWEWGKDGALPGIIMWADPSKHMNEEYYQEFYAGEAEDKGQVLSVTESVTVPAGAFENVVKTYDFSALDPELKENKYYAPGVGVIKVVNQVTGEEEVLIEFTK